MAQCRCEEIAKCNHDIITFGSAINFCSMACEHGDTVLLLMNDCVVETSDETYISDVRESVNNKIIEFGNDLVTALNDFESSLCSARSDVVSKRDEYEIEDKKFHANEDCE